MNIKKIITVGVAGMAMGAMALDNVEVTDVKARQRYPWNGKVDIDFTLDSKATEPYQMLVEVYDNIGKTNLPVKSVCTEGLSFEENPTMVREDTRRIIWDASKDLPNGFKCTNVLVTCRDSRVNAESNRYMIVDLSAGADATKYSITYTDAAPVGGWTEEYMTRKLVLRKIPAGSVLMGSSYYEHGHQENESQHLAVLTKSYYIGVFELTDAQYALITGEGGNTTEPVKKNWYAIRGEDLNLSPTSSLDDRCRSNGVINDYTWPFSQKVAADSLMGKLRTRTNLMFDLPTEAQWERACRGGTITEIYLAVSNTTDNVARMQGQPKRDESDPTGKHINYIGQYCPNAFGLYDMQGNVQEWCLDIYIKDLGTASVVDPVGGNMMSERVFNEGGHIYYTYVLNGYERVVRGSGARSAGRSLLLTLNTNVSWRYGDEKGSNFYTNPTAGIRLAVTMGE